MSKKPVNIRFILLRWHHRIGVIAAVFAVMMAVTGILINHAHEWALDAKALPPSALKLFYSMQLENTKTGYPIGSHWLSLQAKKLYFDNNELASCDAPMAGAALIEETAVAACADSLIYFSKNGELIEKSDLQHAPVQQLGLMQKTLVAKVDTALYALDTSGGDWQLINSLDEIQWVHAKTLPVELQQQLADLNTVPDLSYERLLLDLHSGRLFGIAGRLTVDAAGVALIILACSGSWLWLARKLKQATNKH